MTGVVTHVGTVVKVTAGSVSVKVGDCADKCGGCSAKFLCKPTGDDSGEVIEVPVGSASSWTGGERVKITLSDAKQYSATLLALVLPCVALVAGVAAAWLAGFDEGVCAMSGLLFTAAYFGVLYVMRARVSRKFIWNIEKL